MENRTSNFQDLVWGRPRDRLGFELALEFDIPDRLRGKLPSEKDYRGFRYEVAVREIDGDIRIESERGMLTPSQEPRDASQRDLFPAPMQPPDSILVGGNRRGWRTILSKSRQAKDNFNIETSSESGKERMGDQYRVRASPLSTWKSSGISYELSSFHLRKESVG